MKTSTIEYQGELRTTAVHLLSGNRLMTDPPPDNNGKGEAFSPTDLLATSLGCCMLTIMGILAKRLELDISGARAEITKIMKADPRRVGEVQVEFFMPQRGYSEKERSMLEHAAHTCPVALSLHPDLKQTVTFNW